MEYRNYSVNDWTEGVIRPRKRRRSQPIEATLFGICMPRGRHTPPYAELAAGRFGSNLSELLYRDARSRERDRHAPRQPTAAALGNA